MKLLDLALAEPAANLPLDESLLLEAEEGHGGEVLRLWEAPSYAVIVGAGGSVAIDVNTARCEADEVSVLRRASGGGTVLVGPGCLCFTLVLRTDRAPGLDLIQPSTRYVLGRTLQAIHPLIPGASLEGTSDLVVNGVKFSGNAQQRKRKFFLHHGTLLAGFDLEQVPRYLKGPERQPEYRRGRPHTEFLMNLPTTVAELKRLLIAEWRPEGEYGPAPMERVRVLIDEKYGR
ncbi:MAG TPA: lipoate--protein ligase family protein, partial [Urbifossiella sp.]